MGEWVEGALQRVLWASAESGYAVVRLQGPDGLLLTAVGTLATLAEAEEGVFVSLEGKWESHPVHGRQFRAEGALIGNPKTLEGMQQYLASSALPGIGPALATRIVAAFGLSTPTVLATSPEKLQTVQGIGAKRAQQLHQQWVEDEGNRVVEVTLRALGLSGRLIHKVRERFEDDAAAVVATQPYRLAEEISGIGFKTADVLARRQGIAEDHPARVRAALLHVLRAQESDGHCFLDMEQLARGVAALGVPTEPLSDALDDAEGAGRVMVESVPAGARVYGASLYRAEREVAAELLARSDVQPDLFSHVDEEIRAAQRFEGVSLDDDQFAAVRQALTGGVVVITGGPGTGKTTLVRVLLRVTRERGQRFLLASPTGRAARRLAEATGGEASTLHRLLEFRPGEGGFQRNREQPLEGDGLVIDEVSMVDIRLMAAVLRACPPPPFPLILVGDADQLPSVGPGQVLRDLVGSRTIPVARLTQIHRQAEQSGIVQAARAVHKGQVPVSGERSGHSDVFLLERPDGLQAQATLVKVVAERLVANGYDPFSDVQVLAPTRRGVLGTEALNQALRQALNPDGPELKRGDRSFRLGDRVICVRNRYDVEVFNGDVGRVTRVDKNGLEIDFDGRSVTWEASELGLLELAYAVTVHKSQGSEYKAVVLALHPSHSLMLRRNLFYTAITRAKQFLCVVGSRRAWERSVSEAGGDERHTALAERLALQS